MYSRLVFIPIFMFQKNIQMKKAGFKLNVVAILFTLCCISIVNSQETNLLLNDRPLFKVHKATGKMLADGKMNEKDWERSEVRSFDHVYLDEKPSDIQKTKFRMLWDDKTLYLFYECEDSYITAREKLRDGMPFFDDCAELFLIPAPESANAHICFEVNLYKAVNDLVYVNDFNNGNGLPIKGYNPTSKIGVKINGTVNKNSDIDKGWTMEFAIPIEAFKGADRYFPIKNGTQWSFLALRQDRNDAEGNRRVISTIFPIDNIELKDVHQPSMFGLLEFVD